MKSSKAFLGILAGVIILIIIGIVVFAINQNADKQPIDNHHNHENNQPTGNQPVSTSSVTISNFAFSPATITVKKGTKVTWTNQDDVKHTVTVDNGSSGPSSDLFGKGETYQYTFDTAGTFTYHCQPHPYMKGTVIVTD